MRSDWAGSRRCHCIQQTLHLLLGKALLSHGDARAREGRDQKELVLHCSIERIKSVRQREAEEMILRMLFNKKRRESWTERDSAFLKGADRMRLASEEI